MSLFNGCVNQEPYVFSQRDYWKKSDLPSGSQACRAKPEKRALAQRGLTVRGKAKQYNASRPLKKIISILLQINITKQKHRITKHINVKRRQRITLFRSSYPFNREAFIGRAILLFSKISELRTFPFIFCRK